MAEQQTPYAIECRELTKTFGSVVANDRVNLSVRRGEILALLGENGSGKTTLMNMLSGIYHPDSGEILVDGRPAVISSPIDAMGLGIGMIHQHFKLVEVFSAMDNIVLGTPERLLPPKQLREKILSICGSFGLEIEPGKAGLRDVGQRKADGRDHQGALPRGADSDSRRADRRPSPRRRPTACLPSCAG